jgi:hypothetical protein
MNAELRMQNGITEVQNLVYAGSRALSDRL